MRRSSSLALAGALGAVVLWGLTPVVTKAAVGRLAPLPLLALRLPAAALLLAPFGLPLLARLKGKALAQLCLAGLLGFLGYNLAITFGLTLLPAWLAGMLLALEPVGILGFARLIARERITPRRGLGVLLALVGAAVLALTSPSREGAGHELALGILLTLVATASFAAYSVLLQPIAAAHGALPATSASMLVGCAPYLLAIVTLPGAHLGQLGPSFWGELAFLILGATALGLVLWNAASGQLGNATLAVVLVLEPATSLVGSIALLGERPSAAGVLAGIIVVVGALVAQPRAGRDELEARSS